MNAGLYAKAIYAFVIAGLGAIATVLVATPRSVISPTGSG